MSSISIRSLRISDAVSMTLSVEQTYLGGKKGCRENFDAAELL